jgi:uncharacterized protein
MTPRAGSPLIPATAGRVLAALPLWLFLATAAAAQSPPPVPRDYATDHAGILPADALARLNARLKQFDEETSNQILVIVFPALPSASLEDFTVRTAQAWRAGRGKLDNGAVLFVFVEERKVRIEVGYGLEGALPDVTAHRIIEERITPRFRAGDYAGGLEAGIDAIIAATRGEYKAEPRPAAGTGQGRDGWMIFLVIVALLFMFRGGGGGRTYGRRGYRRGGFLPVPMGWGGGGWGGRGGGFGGGGGFSGGGGSFGGGGASGSW